jgi:hypothetical protein
VLITGTGARLTRREDDLCYSRMSHQVQSDTEARRIVRHHVRRGTAVPNPALAPLAAEQARSSLEALEKMKRMSLLGTVAASVLLVAETLQGRPVEIASVAAFWVVNLALFVLVRWLHPRALRAERLNRELGTSHREHDQPIER